MARATATLPAGGARCRVCGCHEVHTDEVMDGEALFLAECARCDHRWTSRSPFPRVHRIASRGSASARETATAA